MSRARRERIGARTDKDRFSEKSKRRIVQQWSYLERESYLPLEEYLREFGIHHGEFQRWRRTYG